MHVIPLIFSIFKMSSNKSDPVKPDVIKSKSKFLLHYGYCNAHAQRPKRKTIFMTGKDGSTRLIKNVVPLIMEERMSRLIKNVVP